MCSSGWLVLYVDSLHCSNIQSDECDSLREVTNDVTATAVAAAAAARSAGS